MTKFNENYRYSIFYITLKIFENANKLLTIGKYNSAFKFLQKAVLVNVRYKKQIGMHITYTTNQIFNLAKDVHATNLYGFFAIGANMAQPEDVGTSHGTMNDKLSQIAVRKDGEILGQIKIVIDDYETIQYFTKLISEKDYPFKIISSQDALTELEEIEKKLEEAFISSVSSTTP